MSAARREGDRAQWREATQRRADDALVGRLPHTHGLVLRGPGEALGVVADGHGGILSEKDRRGHFDRARGDSAQHDCAGGTGAAQTPSAAAHSLDVAVWRHSARIAHERSVLPLVADSRRKRL